MKVFLGLLILAIIVIYRNRILNAIVSDFMFLRQEPKQWWWLKWKNWGEPLVVAVVLAFIIRTFIVGPYKIPTGSMEKTLMIGDRIFVDKLTYRFREPKRGEIVVFVFPRESNQFREVKLGKHVLFKYREPRKDFVKRLIAFGGERVEIRDGAVFVNGSKVEEPDVIPSIYYYNRNDWEYGKEEQVFTVPEGTFFVLGDNSGHSSDSRNWGFVPKKNLIGRVILIWWPPKSVGLVR